MIEYTTHLQDIPNDTDFSQSIMANTTQLDFHFTWATDIQEIVDVYERALEQRTKSDPLWKNGDIERDYEWLTLYSSTIPHLTQSQVQEWLEETGYVPDSLKQLPSDLLVSEMYSRCREADGIVDYLEPLYNRLVWTVEITDSEGNVASGVVRTGGWINEQDLLWRVQFDADRDIGRDDLGLVDINIEVPEE